MEYNKEMAELFRLQKYKKFESNSQPVVSTSLHTTGCFDCKSTKNLRAIHNRPWLFYICMALFRLQKYKKFESNSQLNAATLKNAPCCFDCKSTKNLRAIHNQAKIITDKMRVVSTAKVQKIWEQFTTQLNKIRSEARLFRLQKYKKFESNSQLATKLDYSKLRCFDCKSTKNLRAIHNYLTEEHRMLHVVSTAKVQKIWEQFTTLSLAVASHKLLFRLQKYKKFESNSQPWQEINSLARLFRLQKYKKFESNSQRNTIIYYLQQSCFDCKSTKNLRAIHNNGNRY